MMRLEGLKKAVERVTGLWTPSRAQLSALVRRVEPEAHRFADDGKTPNNPLLPVLIYRQAVMLEGFDPAAVFERLFATHGWRDAWRDGVYAFNHFHSAAHEVLGIARGFVRIRLGGANGRTMRLEAGDVVVQPAGTGHKRVGGSKDLLVVGAYPEGSRYDEPHATKQAHDEARARIAKVRMPKADPLYGARGPLKRLWRKPRRTRA